MHFEIRQAEARDYEALCALSEQGDRPHREHLPHMFRKPDGPARERDYIQGLLEDSHAALFVAQTGDGLVGYVNVMLVRAAPIPLLAPRSYAVVDNLVVDERCRRQGIGRALMRRAEAWASDKGATSVELNVYEFNHAAHALYVSLGYEDLSRRMSKPLQDTG